MFITTMLQCAKSLKILACITGTEINLEMHMVILMH